MIWTDSIAPMEKAINAVLKERTKQGWRMVTPKDEADPWSRVISNGMVKFAVHAGEFLAMGETKFVEAMNKKMGPMPITRKKPEKEPVTNAP